MLNRFIVAIHQSCASLDIVHAQAQCHEVKQAIKTDG
jgi:hypothetical protein